MLRQTVTLIATRRVRSASTFRPEPLNYVDPRNLPVRLLAAALLFANTLAAATAAADDEVAGTAATAPETGYHGGDAGDDVSAVGSGRPRGRIEFKRQDTNRATAAESTNTTLRFEWYFGGPVSLLRLDLPFPDDKTDFSGSPFDPRRGDLRIRAAFRRIETGVAPLYSFVEATFPTADPESLGTGKYQLSAAAEIRTPVGALGSAPVFENRTLTAQIRQVVSVAGDPKTANINYTKFELGIRGIWRRDYSAKLTIKPVVDWEQEAKTGAVAELEGGWTFIPHWRALLMVGTRLWGSGVPSTYADRVELTVAYTYL